MEIDMKLTGISPEYYAPIKRALKTLNIEEKLSRATLNFVREEGPLAKREGDVITIGYRDRIHIFRSLGLLAEKLSSKGDFELREEQIFKTAGAMPDLSFGSPLKVDTICRLIDYMAVMGLNMILLYIEDLYELPSRPCFGHQRGRYSPDELRAIDDYAHEYGIEAIPCIQTLGHLDKYLHWAEAGDVKETARELSVDKEASYAFIREMLTESTKCFRSKRVHIGMDEAWGLGRGLTTVNKYGYRDQQELFVEHLNKVIKITDEMGLRAMIWNDFIFCLNSKNGVDKYDPDTVVPKAIIEKFPKNVDLVFWHYGEEALDCDDDMLKKNLAFGNNVIFCGGLMMWMAPLPENMFSYTTTEMGLLAAKKNGIEEVFTALWCYGKQGSDIFTTLLHLQQYAEHTYRKNVTRDDLKARFEICTGASFDAFMNMSAFHNKTDREYPDFRERFHGQKFLWQDPLYGRFECFLKGNEMSEHYKKAKSLYLNLIDGGKWSALYETCYTLLDLMETKTYIAESLRPAYLNGDKDKLFEIESDLLPCLIGKIKDLHALYREDWYKAKKPYGIEELEERLAALSARCETAIYRLSEYRLGNIHEIEELNDERMPMPQSYGSQ